MAARPGRHGRPSRRSTRERPPGPGCAPLRVDDDLDRPARAVVEGGQRLGVVATAANWWVIISRTRIRPCSTNGITRRISPADGAAADELELVEDQALHRDLDADGGDAHGGAAAAPAEHAQRPLDRLGDACALERDVRARSPPVIARTAPTGSPAAVSTVSKPMAAALARRWPRPTTMTRPAPRMRAASAREQADRPGPGDGDRVARRDPAAVGDVERDRGRVDDGALVEGQAVGQREDRLDALDDVRRVGALDVVAVLLVEARLAVVLAQVVAALDALLADAAGVVAGARHAVARSSSRSAPRRARGRRSRPPTRGRG